MGHTDFQVFADEVADYFELRGLDVAPSTRLIEDLGMDSLQVYELILLVEDLAEATVPVDLLEDVRTLGDAHHCYLSLFERSS